MANLDGAKRSVVIEFLLKSILIFVKILHNSAKLLNRVCFPDCPECSSCHQIARYCGLVIVAKCSNPCCESPSHSSESGLQECSSCHQIARYCGLAIAPIPVASHDISSDLC
jgi:hypothetical protein